MPARKHHFPKCRHFGYGIECRRCLQAQAMRTKANVMPVDDQNRKDLLDEAARLESADGHSVQTTI
jgi:hypothetical protein